MHFTHIAAHCWLAIFLPSTDTFTILELQNQLYDIPELHKICWSPDREVLKLWKSRSGTLQAFSLHLQIKCCPENYSDIGYRPGNYRVRVNVSLCLMPFNHKPYLCFSERIYFFKLESSMTNTLFHSTWLTHEKNWQFLLATNSLSVSIEAWQAHKNKHKKRQQVWNLQIHPVINTFISFSPPTKQGTSVSCLAFFFFFSFVNEFASSIDCLSKAKQSAELNITNRFSSISIYTEPEDPCNILRSHFLPVNRYIDIFLFFFSR